MALKTQTFGTFTDSSCSISYGGIETLVHESDLSDNPYDTSIYIGSLGSDGLDIEDRVLWADSNPSIDDITLSVVDILPEWEASTAYILDDVLQPTSGGNGYRYKCTVAGTTGASEPTWGTVLNGTTISGTATFTLVSTKHETTEITLALTEAELDTNTPGDSLVLSNEIISGTANAIRVWVRVENNVAIVGNTVSVPELDIQFNACSEWDLA